MYQADQGTLKQAYANQGQAQANAYNEAAPAMTESELVLDRLRTIRSKLTEVYGMSKVANDKIIGPAPEKLQGAETSKPNAIPQGFLANITQIIGEIDSTSSEIAEQLSRLHRSF